MFGVINSKFYITVIICFLFIFSLNVFAESAPVSLIFELNANQINPGQEAQMKMAVWTQKSVNAFDITLKYPSENFEFIRASTADSIVSIWQSLPSAEDGNGILRFVGGMVQPFSGEDGNIITLVFRAKTSGDFTFTVQKADFALADGKGTVISASVISRENTAMVQPKPEILSFPQIIEAIIIEEPITRTPLITAKIDNEGAVRETRLRSREWFMWGEWQKTRLPAAISRSAWAIQLAAVSWEGDELRKTIYRFDVIALKSLFIFTILALLWHVVKSLFKVWKIKK